MICLLHFHNTFARNLKWQIVIGVTIGQKSNFIGGFKLESIITYHILFIVKML